MESGAASDYPRSLLRHALATLAYRGGKAIRGAQPEFADFQAGKVRTPGQILAHIGDLLDWSVTMAEGREAWHDSTPLPWEEEGKRFHAALERLDACLASGKPLQVTAQRLVQGPVADAFSHVGQLAMLRRMASDAIRSENYSVAEIAVGRVGAEQATPKKEFE